MKNWPLAPRALIFAPLEGHTDTFFRSLLARHYPHWDAYYCDFFRLTRVAPKNAETLKKHCGEDFLRDPKLRKKTVFQILTSKEDAVEAYAERLAELEIPWLDLNAGCPMKRVVTHKGGSYLVSNLDDLKNIVIRLRKHFPFYLSAKIRIGLQDDKNFFEILRILEGEGVDAITLHARLQTQMYSGRADWDYIKRAKDFVKIPLIGNGDLCSPSDIRAMFAQTTCDAVMIGRAALRTPWLAKLSKERKENLSKEELKEQMLFYLKTLHTEGASLTPLHILGRLKAISSQLFCEFDNGREIQHRALRSTEFKEFFESLEQL